MRKTLQDKYKKRENAVHESNVKLIAIEIIILFDK